MNRRRRVVVTEHEAANNSLSATTSRQRSDGGGGEQWRRKQAETSRIPSLTSIDHFDAMRRMIPRPPYLVTSATIEGCDCRVGSCGFFHGAAGGTVTVTQQDGSLTFTASGTQPAVGGVNADDTFSVGGAFPLPYSVGQGEDYTVDTGTFEVSGGVPTGIQFQTYQTITGTLEGGSYDCDLVASVTARYEGAVTYYSESPATAATSMFEN
jgi:hypothetical protein